MNKKHDRFRDLYDTYARELYWVALAMCRDESLSEDVVHEVFVQVWERFEKLSDVRDPHAFLVTMTKNKTLDYLRHSQVEYRNEKAVAYEIEFNNSLEYNDLEDLKLRAKRLLDQLPPKCREIFLLAVLDGLSYKEIADQRRVSINTVKTQMKIARKKLKGELPILVAAILVARNIIS